MTFSLPEKLAVELTRRVPARSRSHYVADAVARRLKDRDRLLARAAEVANRNRAVQGLERDFDALTDDMAEPWDDHPPR